jgi:hypothetical protein
MDKKQKAKFQEEWKKPGNRKSGEIINPGSVARGVVKAITPKVVKKIQGKQMVARTKKAVNAVADIQQKVKAETIAKNSVKTKPAMTAKDRAAKNSAAKAKADTAKSGAAARYYAGQVEKKRQLPSKVVKINSKKK